MTKSRYTHILLYTLAALLCATAFFNFVINPFDLFPVPSISGLNSIKIETEHRQRLTKPYVVAKVKPDAVIIGTSRALQLDALNPAFRSLRAYNLALASASAYENYRYLQHAEARHHLKFVIYGIDAFSGGEGTYSGFSDKRLAVTANNKPNRLLFLGYFEDYVPALLSIDALRSSINTITDQPPPHISDPKRYMRTLARKEIVESVGQYKKFADIEAAYLRGAIHTVAHPQSDYLSVNNWISNLTGLEKIINFCYQHRIKLIMFISPSHAHLMEVWRISGKWRDFENWKRAIIAINDREAGKNNLRPFSIWDFSGYNSITTEAVPAPGDKHTEMKWYSEASHYSINTGDLILDRVLHYHQPKLTVPADFGVEITRSNINQVLAHIRKEQSLYIKTHPADVAEIKKLASEIASHQ